MKLEYVDDKLIEFSFDTEGITNELPPIPPADLYSTDRLLSCFCRFLSLFSSLPLSPLVLIIISPKSARGAEFWTKFFDANVPLADVYSLLSEPLQQTIDKDKYEKATYLLA